MGTPCQRQLSMKTRTAAKVSVVLSSATPGSWRYPSNCPLTMSLVEMVRIDLKSFTCSSRTRSMSGQ